MLMRRPKSYFDDETKSRNDDNVAQGTRSRSRQARVGEAADRPMGNARAESPRAEILGKDYEVTHNVELKRGILCNRCNTVLGLCEDDDKLLSSLARYLRKCHG
jgi:hypothetical protein